MAAMEYRVREYRLLSAGYVHTHTEQKIRDKASCVCGYISCNNCNNMKMEPCCLTLASQSEQRAHRLTLFSLFQFSCYLGRPLDATALQK